MQKMNSRVTHRSGLLCALAFLFACTPLLAQQGMPEPPPSPSGPQLQQNPVTAMRNFEPAGDEEYRLGRGDEITIDFTGRPEMQAKLIVGPDGRITLPLAGDLTIADLTRPEAAKLIQSSLENFYSNLAAMITVTKYTSNRVLLLGAVEHPGPVAFDGTPTLLEAITRGGLETNATNKISQIPERCAIYRGSDQIIWVNLRELVETGNAAANLRLRRNDVVYVPSMAERYVSVLGEVSHPGAYPLSHSATIADVIALAGGVTDKAGNNPHVQIINQKTGETRSITFKDVLRPEKSLEIALQPGFVVFVPRTGFYKASYILERINPLVTVMSLAIYAGVL